VYYLLADAASGAWIQALRPGARSLHPLYESGRVRAEIYDEIVEEILAPVRGGRRVCAAFYGHPGIFSYLGHESVRRARGEGFAARMLPAISAADCLFADLGVDPGVGGLQTFEATDFLLYRRSVETTAALVLWQVTAIGDRLAITETNREGLRALADRLLELYPGDHVVSLYEASPYPIADPIVRQTALSALGDADVSPLATLYVPPLRPPRADPDASARLGLSAPD
jgi:uncharacterized protein YabN with tetrapyrrole methylase and pyrophosphatase domain